MTNTPTLLPCPFCGGTNIDPEGWMAGDGRKGPACDDCSGSAESVEMWNRRPSIRPDGEITDEMVEAFWNEWNAPGHFSDGDEEDFKRDVKRCLMKVLPLTAALQVQAQGGWRPDHTDLLRRYIHHVRGYYNTAFLGDDDNNAFHGRRWFTAAEMTELRRLAALPQNKPIPSQQDSDR